tara:strand:- start:4782 stop:5114 length:333 start_codon:yes stop_codon:yes gene_type:complete
MKQITKICQMIGISIALISTSAIAREVGPFEVSIKKLRIDNNSGKLFVNEVPYTDCKYGMLKVDFNEPGGRVQWQTLLSYQLSHDLKNLRVWAEWAGEFCKLKSLEVFPK